MTDNKEKQKVSFLILPNTHILDLAGPVQVFYEANRIGNLNLEIGYTSRRPDVLSEQGIRLTGLQSPGNLTLCSGDYLVLPGIDFDAFRRGELGEYIEELREWVSLQYRTGVRLVSVCTGTLLLAEWGLLKGVACTSHWKCIDYLRKHYPEANVHSDRLFVKDSRIYSSAGMTSGMDMCLAILEEQHGPMLTSKVARELVVFMRRDETHSQESIYLEYQAHFNPTIHRVQDYIISHPSENPTVKQLASLANMSARTLTRKFKEVTGHTITEFKHEVKAEHAKTLLHHPDYTVDEIARKCGYRNSRQLRRIWKEKFNISLVEYR